MFLEGLLAFGGRLEAAGKLGLAGEVYEALVDTPVARGFSPAGSEPITKARHRLDALLGKGPFGLRAELLLDRFTAAATDYRTIVPMFAASAVFQLTKAAALTRMTLNSGTGFFGPYLGKNLSASLLGFASEVSTFTLMSRGLAQLSGQKLAWDGSALGKELLGTGLALGVFKLSAWGGNRAVGALSQTSPRARWMNAALPPVTLLGGIHAAHRLEQAVGLRPQSDASTGLTDSLASLLSLSVGAHLGRRILGPGWGRWMADLEASGRPSPGVRGDLFRAEGKKLGWALASPSLSSVFTHPRARQNLSAPIMSEKLGGPESPEAPGPGPGSWKLRDYQEKMLTQLEADAKAGTSPWLAIASPMQTGKSFLIGPIIERLRPMVPEGTPFIILSMSRVITDQVVRDLISGYPMDQIGRFDGIQKDIKPVTVASIFSLVRHLDQFRNDGPTVLINDEAFATQARSFRRVYQFFGLGKEVKEGKRKALEAQADHGLVVGLSGTGAGLKGYHVSGQLDLMGAIDAGWVRHMQGERVFLKISSQKVKATGGEKMIWWRATPENARTLAEIYQEKIAGKFHKNLVFVPTIRHGELMKEALEKLEGSGPVHLIHSRMMENEIQKGLAAWAENGGALVSVRKLSRGFRGTGADAVFHTYQSTSPELFSQRTGRAWGISEGEAFPDLFVLEATWSRQNNFANLARLLGLVEYPFTFLQTRKVKKAIQAAKRRRPLEKARKEKVSRGEVSPLYLDVPLAEEWRTIFTELLNANGGIAQLHQETGLDSGTLTAFALGCLPTRLSQIEALERFLGGRQRATELWVRAWEEVASEMASGGREWIQGLAEKLESWEREALAPEEKARRLDPMLSVHFKGPVEKGPETKRDYFLKMLRKRTQRPLSPAQLEEILDREREIFIKINLALHPYTKDYAPLWEWLFARRPGPIDQIDLRINGEPGSNEQKARLIEYLVNRFLKFVDYERPLDPRDYDIQILPLGKKTLLGLREENIQSLGNLADMTAKEVRKIHGVGRGTIIDIRKVLEAFDMDFKAPSLRKNQGIPQPPKGDFAAWAWKSVEELELSTGILHSFMNNGKIHYVGDLTAFTAHELLEMNRIGKRSVKEIEEKLQDIGLRLGMKKEWDELRGMPAADPPQVVTHSILDFPVEGLPLRTSQISLLRDEGYRTIRDVVKVSSSKFSDTMGVGKETFLVVRKFFETHGLSFGMVPGPSTPHPPLRDAPLEELGSYEFVGLLKKKGILTLSQLLRLSQSELSEYYHLDWVSVIQIKQVLSERGLYLEMKMEWIKKDPQLDGLLESPTDILPLSLTTHLKLKEIGIQKIADLINLGEAELAKRLEPKAYWEIKEALLQHNLKMGP